MNGRDEPEDLAAFVHRLGSPLGALRNYASLLPGDDLADGVRSSVEGVCRLLDATRSYLQAARLEPALESVSPADALEAAVAHLDADVRERVSIDGDLAHLAAVRADREALPRAIGLVLTALAGDAGLVSVCVRGEAASGRVLLRFGDDRAPWSEHDRVRVLRPFAAPGQSGPDGLALPTAACLLSRQGGHLESGPSAADRVIIELEVA